MPEPIKRFGSTAISLARNPLGTIALFIVMVYGFGSLATVFTDAFTATNAAPHPSPRELSGARPCGPRMACQQA